ncbi:MAG: c-type cytochrome, partial [Dehalococcoidia bacterium]
LGPAEGSVPFTIGAEPGQELTDVSLPLMPIEPASQTEALLMTNPVPNTSETLERARNIYLANCSMCHGVNGRADTFTADAFKDLEIKPPADLATAGSIVASPTDGLAFWIISDGLGNMPSWRLLLTQEERWTVIHYLRFLSDQANQ